MKTSDMNIIITGTNIEAACVWIDCFSKRAAFMVDTIRKLLESVRSSGFTFN